MGFWKSFGRMAAQKDAKDKARKAQIAQAKAGKTFRRTGHQLRKADRAERAAASSQALADKLKQQERDEAEANRGDRPDLRPGEPATRLPLKGDKKR